MACHNNSNYSTIEYETSKVLSYHVMKCSLQYLFLFCHFHLTDESDDPVQRGQMALSTVEGS